MGILDGITRRLILDSAGELGIRTKEGRFFRRDVYRADEVFISSTTREIIPVSKVDGTVVGSRIGKITGILLSAYRKKVREYIEREDRRKKDRR